MSDCDAWLKATWDDGQTSLFGPYLREYVSVMSEDELRQSFTRAVESPEDEPLYPVSVVVCEAPVNWWRNGERIA